MFLNILPWCRSILILLELCQLDKKLRIFLLTLRMKNGYPFHQNYVEVNIVANVSFEDLFFFIIRGSSYLVDDLGTHISNTREAKAFALLSEEGIAKGIRRITAVTTDRAYDAMKVADEFEQQVDDASKLDGSLLEEVGIWVSVHIRFSRKLGLCFFPFYSS